jgi:ADP-ribose pyrophosphatase YjhB (NUDIX family)/predicted transcriptional regulator
MYMIDVELHKAQLQILRNLRYNPARRYSELQKPTGLDSDVFKFHVRKLVKHGYLEKTDQGLYSLTSVGKEFANNLSKVGRGIQKQPKLSVVLVIRKDTLGEVEEYLFQQRKRSPFFDYWGCISGPVQWGESFEDAAKREAEKQAGLSIIPKVSGFIRKSDYDAEDGTMFEDKLFAVVDCTVTSEDLKLEWPGGVCEWLTVDALTAKPKYFESTTDYIKFASSDTSYMVEKAEHDKNAY